MRFNSKLAGFKSSIFTEMTALANKHSAVNLGQGFPNFNPHGQVGSRLLQRASEEILFGNKNQYCRSSGVLDLCQAVQQQFKTHQQLEYHAESEVTVFSGATEALFATLAALLNPGDEVVLFQPHYDSYLFAIEAMRANARVVTLRPHGDRFTFDYAELERAFVTGVAKPPKVLVLNSPHNPTGTVFSKQELEQIAKLCIQHDCLVVSDEVYEHITFDQIKHTSIATLPGMRDRTVCISSAGKTFSVTGWKVGWALANREITEAIRTCHQYVTFSTATPFQHALSSVLGDLPAMQQFITELQHDYQHKRDKLCHGLTSAGLKVAQLPQGAYFALVDISPTKYKTDVDFCRQVTTQVGVCAIPNSAFYSRPILGETDKYARFAFCKTDHVLDLAIEKLIQGKHHLF
ncbi:hypothetical protein BASA81_002002 [Batrachochytrium salamandrivorans]|nr:hypothetical protein BASA81_002002 [Batrachochytrium salamandrivorans]